MIRVPAAPFLLASLLFACAAPSTTGPREASLARTAHPTAAGSERVAARPAASQDASVWTPHRIAELRAVGSAVVSPDGSHVAYTVYVPRQPMVEEDGGSWSELHVLDVASGESRPYVSGAQNVGSVDWTPDGRGITFLARRGGDRENALYVLPVDGGEARKAVQLSSSIAGYSLAPDGKRVALLAAEREAAERKKEKDQGFAQEIYEEDWRPTRLWIATLFADGETREPLAIDGSLHEVRWSPTADELAIAVTPTPGVDDEYVRQRVLVVDPSGRELWAPAGRQGKLGAIEWSPDGQRLAFGTGEDQHDPSAGRLRVASHAEPGGVAALASGLRTLDGLAGDVTAFTWTAPDRLGIVLHEGVDARVVELGPAGLSERAGPGGAIPTSIHHAGPVTALVASTPAAPPELHLLGDGRLERRSDSNPALARLRLADQEVVRFRARDGLELEGLLMRPLDVPAGERVPLVLIVHGGPESHYSNGWLTNYSSPGQALAARGFAVFYPNYRGSTGRGVEFSKLSQGDPAGKEFDDLVDAVDHLVGIGLVDRDRVGVTGGSYGGYATAWCSTYYSERFAAGVMFVGISDKISKVGTTDIPDEEYFVHARHRIWEDWQLFLERSPIYHAAKGRTPLLILHGKDDPRVNPGQSRELHRHLKLHGQTPVRLVLYPGEGHGNRKAAARLDYSLRLVQWFEHYLQGPGGTPPVYDLDYADPDARESA